MEAKSRRRFLPSYYINFLYKTMGKLAYFRASKKTYSLATIDYIRVISLSVFWTSNKTHVSILDTIVIE
jgi:hypothetical protein